MCGIVGLFGHPEAAHMAYLGLHTLQHRGQESAGIVSGHQGKLYGYRQMAKVADAFTAEALERLPGDRAIGHVRYSTTGQSLLKNAQPFWVDYVGGGIAIAHNGNLVDSQEIRSSLEAGGSIFQSSMDTECIIHLMAAAPAGSMEDRLRLALRQVRGAYSLLLLTETEMIAARDPHGFRPLVIGEIDGATVFASETCALHLIGAKFVREVAPGEAVIVDESGVRSVRMVDPAPRPAPCAFEFVYFARPDSRVFGGNVYTTRKALGRALAREAPADVDLVIPVPDSGVTAALGYAEAMDKPFEMGLIRSHYVGRTFIEPQSSIRNFGVKLKLTPVREVIEGKRVAVVDDSIVRGTTSRKIVSMLRQSGAEQVHFRVSSPPTRWPCYYGIDTPTREELIASSHSVEQICDHLGADSLRYLSLDGMLRAIGDGDSGASTAEFCHACWSGEYRVPPAARPSAESSA